MKKSTPISSLIIHHSSFWAALTSSIIILCVVGCGENTSSRDDLPPSRPRMVHRSADTDYAQVGIRAEPTEGDFHHWARIEWYANPEPDVAGYQIWRLSEFHPLYDRYVVADLRVGTDPELPEGASRYAWVDRGDSAVGFPADVLAPDPASRETRGYFWMIIAYDTAGNRSAISDSAYFRMMNNPLNARVSRIAANVYSILWEYSANPDIVSVSNYMVRVYPTVQGPDSVVWFQFAQRYTSAESVQMDFTQALRPLVSNGLYTCQLNVFYTRASTDHADSLAGAAVKTTFLYQN